MTSIFISHSKKDWNIIQVFLNAFNGTGVRPILMEYERYVNPPWSEIKNAIGQSSALFVLLGTNLKSSDYTQNWVSYEVGVADTLNRPIWVFEDINNTVRFPIPNVHHYMLYNPSQLDSMNYLRTVIGSYAVNGDAALAGGLLGLVLSANPIVALAGLLLGSKVNVPATPEGLSVQCPYYDCRVTFQFHNGNKQFLCPACRRGIRLTS